MRPTIVDRLSSALADCTLQAGTQQPPPGDSEPPPSVTSRHRLQSAIASSLHAIAGSPGTKPDMSPALAPLVALLSPGAAGANRRTAGIAAGALFRLAQHPPFKAHLRDATELPSHLSALGKAPSPPLEPAVAGTIAALAQTLQGSFLVSPASMVPGRSLRETGGRRASGPGPKPEPPHGPGGSTSLRPPLSQAPSEGETSADSERAEAAEDLTAVLEAFDAKLALRRAGPSDTPGGSSSSSCFFFYERSGKKRG